MEKFLHFQTNTQSFLVPLSNAHRVTFATPPKALPFVPEYIHGIVHFEGSIWVVIDLDTILGHPSDEELNELVLVKHADFHLAFRARRSRDLIEIDPSFQEKRSVPNLPDPCLVFVSVVEGELAYCLDIGEFIQEFSVK